MSTDGTAMILEQSASMQQANCLEFERLEAESKHKRARMQAEKEKANEELWASIARMQAPVNPPVFANPAKQTPSQWSGQTQAQLANAGHENTTPNQGEPAPGPSQPTLEGQPPQPQLTPEDLTNDDNPLRTLQCNDSTSGVAAIILKEVGLAQAIALNKAAKKSGYGSKLSKSKREAKF